MENKKRKAEQGDITATTLLASMDGTLSQLHKLGRAAETLTRGGLLKIAMIQQNVATLYAEYCTRWPQCGPTTVCYHEIFLNMGFGQEVLQHLSLEDTLSFVSLNKQFVSHFHCTPPSLVNFRFWAPSKFIISQIHRSQLVARDITIRDDFIGKLILPNTLLRLTLSETWNRPTPIFPSGLTHLNFGDDFDFPLSELPLTLTHLSFGSSFDQSIDMLPQSLTHLAVGSCFATRITTLPPNLLSFAIAPSDSDFNFLFDVDFLPNSLKELQLHLPGAYSASISLPDHLSHLTVELHRKTKNKVYLSLESCTSLEFIRFDGRISVDNMPHTITHCYLGSRVCCSDKFAPSNLRVLTLHGLVSWKNLPKTIHSLDISYSNELSYRVYGLRLRSLRMGKGIEVVTKRLPTQLLSLHLYSCETSLSHLPPLLTHLTIHNGTIPIDDIPPTVTHLFLPTYTNPIQHLPARLQHLELGKYEHPLRLPNSLRFLGLVASASTPTLFLPNDHVNVCMQTNGEVKLEVSLSSRRISFAERNVQ